MKLRVSLVIFVVMAMATAPVKAIEVSSFEPLLVAGKWAEAEKQLEGAVARDGKDDSARFALGSVQLKAMLLDVGDAGSPSAVRRVLGQGLNLEA